MKTNFSDSELTNSEIAKRYGIVNAYTLTQYRNCEMFLRPGLEHARKLLGNNRMITTSGFRNPAINCIANGSMTKTSLQLVADLNLSNYAGEHALKRLNAGRYGNSDSAHMLFLAWDGIVPEIGSPYEVCKILRDTDLEFDQLIYEFQSWVHISFDPRKRKEVLTIDNRGVYRGLRL